MLEFQDKRRGVRVKLLCLFVEPARYVCATVVSSHLMNFATHEALYCLFPEATFRRRKMCISSHDWQSWSQYVDRRFSFVSFQQCLSCEEFHGMRRIGDGLSIRVPFSGREVMASNRLGHLSFWVSESGVQMNQEIG